MPTGLSRDLPGAIGMAAALRAKLIKEAFEGRWFPDKSSDCSLGEAVAEYLGTIASKRSAKETEARLQRAIDFFGKSTPVSTIRHSKIRAWQIALSEETIRGGKKREAQTIVHHLVNLRSAFRAAVKAKLTAVDPMEGYDLPDVSNARKRVATDDELIAIVAASRDRDDHDLADAVLLARELGLRQEKIVGMRWELADRERRIYSVPPTPGGKPVPDRVPLSMIAIQVLEQRGWKREGSIFPDVTANQISLRFGRLVRDLKIKDLRFHDLRHTIFTELERAGVGLRTIKEWSGHKTVQNLFRYQTVDDAHLVSVADKVRGGNQ